LHVTQSSPSQVKYCQYCGKGLTIDAKFCLDCGKPTPQPPLPRHKMKVWQFILGIILAYSATITLGDLLRRLFGFFLFPFLLIVCTIFLLIVFLYYILVARKKPSCPKCNKILPSYPSDMTHCPYCGNVLEPSFKKFCVYCGSGMASDGRFCPNCGKEQLKPEVGRSIG